jgi:hypothetical protein
MVEADMAVERKEEASDHSPIAVARTDPEVR